MKIVLDGANGSTSSLAPFLFGDLEADTETVGCSPDGYNINENAVLHILKHLQKKFLKLAQISD